MVLEQWWVQLCVAQLCTLVVLERERERGVTSETMGTGECHGKMGRWNNYVCFEGGKTQILEPEPSMWTLEQVNVSSTKKHNCANIRWIYYFRSSDFFISICGQLLIVRRIFENMISWTFNSLTFHNLTIFYAGWLQMAWINGKY